MSQASSPMFALDFSYTEVYSEPFQLSKTKCRETLHLKCFAGFEYASSKWHLFILLYFLPNKAYSKFYY